MRRVRALGRLSRRHRRAPPAPTHRPGRRGRRQRPCTTSRPPSPDIAEHPCAPLATCAFEAEYKKSTASYGCIDRLDLNPAILAGTRSRARTHGTEPALLSLLAAAMRRSLVSFLVLCPWATSTTDHPQPQRPAPFHPDRLTAARAGAGAVRAVSAPPASPVPTLGLSAAAFGSRGDGIADDTAALQ
jgi:hypothetical protein